MNCKRATRKVERELRLSSKEDCSTPEELTKSASPVTADGSIANTRVQMLPESLQVEQLARPSASFEITARKSGSIKEEKGVRDVSGASMCDNERGGVGRGSWGSEDTILAERGKDAAKELILLNTLLQASAFRLVKPNTERLVYLYTKISKKICKGKPRTKGSAGTSLQTPARPPHNSPAVVSWAGEDLHIEVSASPRGVKRSAPEPQSVCCEETFRCRHCGSTFRTGQALGGHMSRKHSGKSQKYNHKKDVRVQREFERMKLHVAKKIYFEQQGCDYEKMMQSVEGRMRAKSLINRSQIKKIKASLAEREVYAAFK